MNLRRLSDYKLGLEYNVPVYYKHGDFISEEIGRRKLHLRWKIKEDGTIMSCGFKRRFWQSLSIEYSFKMVNIEDSSYTRIFDFEKSKLNLSIVKCFYINFSKQQMRDYKIGNLVK